MKKATPTLDDADGRLTFDDKPTRAGRKNQGDGMGFPSQSAFLDWETRSRDVLSIKRAYCDLAGDLIAGIVLSQILFWHLPGKEGVTKLRVELDGELWLAKSRSAWWEECRLSPKQASTALTRLRRLGLIVVRNSMFAGKRTPFIRILWPNFLERWRELPAAASEQASNRAHSKGSVLTDGAYRSYRSVHTDRDQRSKSSYIPHDIPHDINAVPQTGAAPPARALVRNLHRRKGDSDEEQREATG